MVWVIMRRRGVSSERRRSSYPQVWRRVSGLTYKIIHQMNFVVSAIGFHDIPLSSEKRDMVETGDVIGLFTRLSTENPVIGFDTYPCSPIPTLLATASGVTTPLTFYEDSVCRHYSMKARFVGNIPTKRNNTVG